MTDSRIYFGRPGALAALRFPRGDFEATRVRRTSTFDLGIGGVSVDQMIGGARTFTINYAMLFREDWATLQAFLDGHEGPGPFALLDPGQRNMLPANIAGATSVTNDVAGLAPVGGFLIRSLDDDFNRAPVASGAGTALTGQTWTNTGGTAGQYAVSGGVATIASDTTNVVRSLTAVTGHTDFDVTADIALGVGTPTGAAISQFVYGRYGDANNFYQVSVQVTTAGAVTIQLGKRVSASGATIGNATTLATSHTSGAIWRVHFQGIQSGGTCNLKASAWPLATMTAEPSTWQLTNTDAALTTGTGVGVAVRLETGNTNVTPVTFTCYGITAESMATTESSSTAFTDAGPRVLAVNFTAAPTGGAVGIGLDWPSATFDSGVPLVANRAVCFSCYVRGGGTDAITTWTPKIVWRDASDTVVSTTTSGSGAVTSSSGAWTQMYATSTPPAGAVYADLRVDYTSGASAGAVAYFRRFLFNEGSTPDTTWTPGTGVFPVRFLSAPEAWPLQSPELRTSPTVVLQEDVS